VLASALISIVREEFLDDVSDAVAGYEADARWSDSFLLRLVGQAQRQACYRSDLRHLYDATTAAICTIPIVSGTQGYALDPRILRLHEVLLDTTPLLHTSQARLDETGYGWCATFFVHQRTLYLDTIPTSGTLHLSVWREPLEDPGIDDTLEWTSDPEALGHWVAYRAFLVPDEDLNDKDRAAFHLEQFNAAFGAPTTARERLEVLGAPPSLFLHPSTGYAQPVSRWRPFDIAT
jgi:hypothetical protein